MNIFVLHVFRRNLFVSLLNFEQNVMSCGLYMRCFNIYHKKAFDE